ncbi:hypothetical protein Vafri_5292 [Volvox africanus]|uniref:Uncharacterized protein n=1 Tax=Volvox africanus TaxID=51714 RepID=A0A8J4EUT6_9CHLO|nr:hypothetical protein Vafri_5292 [Volvox africanus]
MAATATHRPKLNCYLHGLLFISIVLHVHGYTYAMAALSQFSPGVIATAGKTTENEDSIFNADCAGETNAKCSEGANYWSLLRERQAMLSKAKSSRTAFDTGDSDRPPFLIGTVISHPDDNEADAKSGRSRVGIWDWLRERQRGVAEPAGLNKAEAELIDVSGPTKHKSPGKRDSAGHVDDPRKKNLASAPGTEADLKTRSKDATTGGEEAASIDMEGARATTLTCPPVTSNVFFIAATRIMVATLVVGFVLYWLYPKRQIRRAASIPAVPVHQEVHLSKAKTSTSNLVQLDASDMPKIGKVEASAECHVEALQRAVTAMSPDCSFRVTACTPMVSSGSSDRDGRVLSNSIYTAGCSSCLITHAPRPKRRISDSGSSSNGGGSDGSGDVGCTAVLEPSMAAEAADLCGCVAGATKAHTATTKEADEVASGSSSDVHSEHGGCVSSSPTMPAAEASIPKNGGAEDFDSCSCTVSPAIKASALMVAVLTQSQLVGRPVVAVAAAEPQPSAAPLRLPKRQPHQLSIGDLHEEMIDKVKNAAPLIQQQQQQRRRRRRRHQLQGPPSERLMDAPWVPGAMSAEAVPVAPGPTPGDMACAASPDGSGVIGPYLTGGIPAFYDAHQLQVQQLQLQLTERHMMKMVATMMEAFDSRMTEFVGVVSENTGAVQQLNSNMRRVISVNALEEQRHWVMACMQRGMVVMWISLVVASLRLGRLKDVAWTCSQDVPARAPEFGRTSVLRSTGSWGLRLTNWALGLSGWGNTPSGTNARVTNTDSSWSSWGWNQMASLLSSRLYPSFLKTALCYVQELGLQAFGILLVVFLLHPLLRSMLSVNMRHSWRIDVPVILGGLWAVAGCVTIHCLGGHWTVWLAGWWIWCGTGYVMHMKELLSGWAKVAVAVFLVGAPVVIIGAAFVAPALQVHGFVQG